MRFKAHKITKVDKNICCCEQKIAYNYGFMNFDILKKVKENCIAIQFQESLQDTINSMIQSCEENGISKKYNIDLIVIAYRQAMNRDFLNHKTGILKDYEEIGRYFNIPYDIE